MPPELTPPADTPSSVPSRTASIVARAPMPIVEVQGSAHQVSYVNAAFCSLLGRRREELIGRPFSEIVPGGDACIPLLDQVYQTGEPVTHSLEGESEASRATWLFAMWPALDPDDVPVRVIVQMAKVPAPHRDVMAVNEALLLAALRQEETAEKLDTINTQLLREIAERKRGEAALQASERDLVVEVTALAQLQRLSGSLWRSVDFNHSLGDALDASMALLGADKGHVQILHPHKAVLEIVAQRGFDKDFLDFFREVATTDESACGQALREGKTTIIEDVQTTARSAPYRKIAAAAGYRAVISTPLIERGGKPLGMLSMHFRRSHRPTDQQLRHLDLYVRQTTDFISWMHALAEIAESEARLRFMAESMPQKISTTRPSGEVDYFNQQWVDFTGLPFEELRERGWTQCVHPDDVEETESRWAHSLATGDTFQVEHRIRRADGVYLWHLTRALPMRDAQGSLVMWIGSTTDIHAQKQLIEDLAAADRHKDEFLAMLSHEIRNPLAPILTAANLLRMAKTDNPTVLRAQAIIERQAEHLERLVADLLDVSRIQKGKVRLRNEQVDVSAAIARTLDSCEHLITAQHHTVMLALHSDPPLLINGDPTRVDQIFVNLIGNAVKYTPPNGNIAISAAREAEMVVVRVRDSGIGIAPEMLLRVFDVFTQVEQSLERSKGGLGIGLKLVKELAELHGGTVEALSEGLGKGSEFIVRLPAAAKNVEVAIAEVKAPAVRRTLRILVVDDNDDIRETMQMLLEMSGHQVVVAADGQAAVDLVFESPLDVAFVDIGLPTLSGYHVAQEIRRRPGGDRIVLIALSGYGQAADKRKALEAGFDAHLTKPVDGNAISQILDELDQFHRKQL